MNNVKKSIGWCDYTWNPVTGCLRECEYCYARIIWNRFFKDKYDCEYNKIVFHPDRLKDPDKVRKPSKIFVGSMSDVFYYSTVMMKQINDTIERNKHHTFMFLSKSITAYAGKVFLSNSMIGLTVTSINDSMNKSSVKCMSRYRRPFLSIEPLHGPITIDISNNYEVVIVGSETGNSKGRIIPQKDWIQSIKDHVPEDKIYWKKNILKYL